MNWSLVDSSSSDEEGILERAASTPLARLEVPNYRVVLEIPHSPAEVTVGEEEYFDLLLESLVSDCKRMKLSLGYESIRSEKITDAEGTSEDLHQEEPTESPESPDESLNSEIFVVEGHQTPEGSVSSSQVLQYLEQVAQEDSNSCFVTPPGPLKKAYLQNSSPLNDLEKQRVLSKTPLPA